LKAAAAIRANVLQFAFDTLRAEGALIGANPGVLALRKKIAIAELAIGSQLKGQWHGLLIPTFPQSYAVVWLAEMTKNVRFQPNTTRRVEVVAFRGAQLLDVTGPLQIFASANEFAAESGRATPYAVSLVSRESTVVTSSGLKLFANPLPNTPEAPDTLVVAGGGGVDDAMANDRLVEWIRFRAGMARRTVSVCTGAFLLAEAGLLDGRSAVTHWARCVELAQRFPSIKVHSKPIFVRDGAVWTSAGVTAGMDLCLALVEEDLGREIALAIARDLVMFLKRPGDQAQYSLTLSLQKVQRFEQLHSWIQENLSADLTTPALARQCGMSERTFIRRYGDETGYTPARMVERLRIECAQRMLAETDEPLKIVALRSGFRSEAILRRSFARVVSMSPNDYRRVWAPDGTSLNVHPSGLNRTLGTRQ